MRFTLLIFLRLASSTDPGGVRDPGAGMPDSKVTGSAGQRVPSNEFCQMMTGSSSAVCWEGKCRDDGDAHARFEDPHLQDIDCSDEYINKIRAIYDEHSKLLTPPTAERLGLGRSPSYFDLIRNRAQGDDAVSISLEGEVPGEDERAAGILLYFVPGVKRARRFNMLVLITIGLKIP